MRNGCIRGRDYVWNPGGYGCEGAEYFGEGLNWGDLKNGDGECTVFFMADLEKML